MNRVGRIALVGMIAILLATALAFAETSAQNPLEWLDRLETETYGNPSKGGVFERLNRLEETLIGKNRDENLVKRLTYLDQLMFVNKPHDISLIYKVQALEWLIYKASDSGALIDRTGNIEMTLFQRKFNGPLNQRLEKLISQIFPDGVVKSAWVTIPEGLRVKVKMIDPIHSATNKVGDEFRYEVMETVYQGRQVIFPVGMIGRGVLKTVKRPEKLGNDARLTLDFREIRALDGTSVKVGYSLKARDSGHSRRWVVGASTAGMLAFGPEGILIGLAVKGKEREIPTDTEFYLEVTESVRVFTLLE